MEDENKNKKPENKKDPFAEIMEDLEKYEEGCEKRNLTDSGE